MWHTERLGERDVNEPPARVSLPFEVGKSSLGHDPLKFQVLFHSAHLWLASFASIVEMGDETSAFYVIINERHPSRLLLSDGHAMFVDSSTHATQSFVLQSGHGMLIPLKRDCYTVPLNSSLLVP